MMLRSPLAAPAAALTCKPSLVPLSLTVNGPATVIASAGSMRAPVILLKLRPRMSSVTGAWPATIPWGVNETKGLIARMQYQAPRAPGSGGGDAHRELRFVRLRVDDRRAPNGQAGCGDETRRSHPLQARTAHRHHDIGANDSHPRYHLRHAAAHEHARHGAALE